VSKNEGNLILSWHSGVDNLPPAKRILYNLNKKSFSVSLNLTNLDKGEYSIVVDVIDLLTEKTDMKYFQSKYK